MRSVPLRDDESQRYGLPPVWQCALCRRSMLGLAAVLVRDWAAPQMLAMAVVMMIVRVCVRVVMAGRPRVEMRGRPPVRGEI